MKTILFGTTLLLLSSSLYAQCMKGISGDGRLWPTEVKKVVLHKTGCRAIPHRGQTDSNPMCPLDDSGVISRGIEVGAKKGVCNYEVGDSISGNLVNVDDEIMLERHFLELKEKKEKGDVVGDETTSASVNNSNDRHNEKGSSPASKPSKKSSGATAQ